MKRSLRAALAVVAAILVLCAGGAALYVSNHYRADAAALAIAAEAETEGRFTVLPAAVGEWVIPGGDHAYFGNYGEQDGDGEATITREEQQSVTAQMVLAFMDRTE